MTNSTHTDIEIGREKKEKREKGVGERYPHRCD